MFNNKPRKIRELCLTQKKRQQKREENHLEESLEDMKSHCLENGVNRISIPRIGCGLDQLQWSKVSKILEQIFKETNISITVYSLPCVGSKLQMHAV
uniref:Macro domain-containing protein n=1 Tax=Xiphophorus couchianus TaxID=32473 RepID=A0A3B5M1Q0_9TELE